MFNFTYVEFPCTVDLNIFKAYFDPKRCILPKIHGETIEDGSTGGQARRVFQSLRHLVLDAIIENWRENPMYHELPTPADRNYLLSNLKTDLPLRTLSAHIREDFFWRRSYRERWRVLPAPSVKPAWINAYMERHLQEFVQQLDPDSYEPRRLQAELDVCAAYINQLEIECLQPSMRERNASVFVHIPLDCLLSNLRDLRALNLTYAAVEMGFHYYPGCNRMSRNDILYLAKGLSRCHELRGFRLHSTKLEAYQLPFLARSLDKGCHHLTSLSLVHTAIGDEGLMRFLQACHRESFATLKSLDLTNNKITSEGALRLSRTFEGRALEKLVLRRNPIGSDGAAAIFSTLHHLPLRLLDLAVCSLCDGLTRLFMRLIVENKSLRELNLTNNDFSEDFGKQLYKVIGFNRTLQKIDFRITRISLQTRSKINEVLCKNIEENADISNKIKCRVRIEKEPK